MTSLLRMSEQEIAQQSQGLRFWPALAIAVCSSALALGGMMLRFRPGDEVPIHGMDTLTGQIRLAAAMGLLLVLAAWLVRTVLMKRLQWAVLISLLVHFLLCIALRTVHIAVPLSPFPEVAATEKEEQQIALPDYGGAEEVTNEPQEWERSVDVQLPEQQQPQRPEQSVPEIEGEPEPVEVQRSVQRAEVPEERQRQEELEEQIQVQMQMQARQAQMEAPAEVEAPEIETAEARESELDAQQMQRNEARPDAARREMTEIEAERQVSISAASVQPRTDVRPDSLSDPTANQPTRQTPAEIAAADSSAEIVEAAEVAAVSSPSLNPEQSDILRQHQAQLNDRTRPDESQSGPASSRAAISVSRVLAGRPSSASSASMSAPSAGGRAPQLSRSTSASGAQISPSAAVAESVEVSAAAAGGDVQLQAAGTNNSGRRAAAVPSTTAAGGGFGPATTSGRGGARALPAGMIGRGQGLASGPAIGDAGDGGQAMGRTGQAAGRTGVAAVGANAENVTLAGAGGAAGSVDDLLGSGPAGRGRSNSRGESGNGGRNGGAELPGGPSGGGDAFSVSGPAGRRTIAMNAAGRSGLAGRSDTGGARLRGSIAGGRGLPSGRSTNGLLGVPLPAGSLEAEQSGALVMDGPGEESGGRGSQGSAVTNGRGELAGPRSTGSRRRTAGLPGLPGPAGGVSGNAKRRGGLPGGLSPARVAARGGSAGAAPSLSSATEIAGMIRRSVRGISDLPTERVSAAFSMRSPEARREAVQKLGGSPQSEAAVERGLEWLAAHQYAAGNWSIHRMNCKDHDCGGHGSYEADPAATGLALLAFLGAGYTHDSGPYQTEVRRGLQFLIRHQAENGDLFAAPSEFAKFYSHGIATIALCEAYGMTHDASLREPAQKAISFIAESQHPVFGGWRYRPRFESDTSVSGWQLMAVKSAEMAELDIPSRLYTGVRTWLNSVEDADNPGRFRYHPSKEVTEVMTAEGLLMRQYLGADRADAALKAGASYLQQRLPRSDARNAYYWYYATQVMFHLQGDDWKNWNGALRDLLVETQEKGGPQRGSWNPVAPSKDTWGLSGGRHYVTCLNLLMLEVYYRHLPLYIKLTQ